mmetsp:Transcript_6117/g.7111  ORF Transcript_6117/g.7111 Transcript_6117/m.7111 type:complete len:156 (+) Transcript_6117:13-480(+)
MVLGLQLFFVLSIIVLNALPSCGRTVRLGEAPFREGAVQKDADITGVKRMLEDYYVEEQQGDDAYYKEANEADEADDANGADDTEYTWRGDFDDDFVHHYRETTKAKFYEIFQSAPSNYTSDQWTFFAGLMTLLFTMFCCICMIFVVPCFQRRRY